MERKIIIIGGVAGGGSAAARLRRLSEADRIIMFERGLHVSFSNCCLPYHLSGMIADADDLVLMDPDLFFRQYRIDARVDTAVISINRANKTVQAKNLVTGETYFQDTTS